MTNEQRYGDTIWSRLSRRQLLRGAALAGAGLAGAALIGCSDDDDDGAAVSGEKPQRGGTLTVAQRADVHSLDPALSTSSPEDTLTMQTYNNLVLRQADGSLAPQLAESWEGNDDLSSYTFKLRGGVKFHNGKELTAEDVKYTFERLLAEETGSPAAAAVDFIDKIVVVDDLTVRFDLSGPNSFAPDTLSLYQGRIIPSNVDESRLALEEFGSGPFILTSFKPNESAVFERNPDYWDKDLPYLDKIVFLYFPEEQARSEAVKSGAVDIAFPLSVPAAEDISASPGVRVDEAAGSGYLNLAMRTDREPFTDVRVRRALQLAMDRDLVNAAAVLGRGTIGHDIPIPPGDLHDTGLTAPPYDAAGAKKLLAGAGFPEGLDVTLYSSTVSPGMLEMAQAFKESAAPAGINVSIMQVPEDSYWSDTWLTEPFTTVNWAGRNPDQAISIVYKSDAAWNEAYYLNDALDALIIKARGQDLEGRRESYRQIHEMLLDDVPRIIPVFKPILVALRDKVRGVVAHPSEWLILHEAWLAS